MSCTYTRGVYFPVEVQRGVRNESKLFLGTKRRNRSPRLGTEEVDLVRKDPVGGKEIGKSEREVGEQ